jgi:two-component system, LytTR family, response regulator
VITALIVDDERLARQGIRMALRDEPDVKVVGELSDGPSAVKAIVKHRPELVFLDIRMPGLSGFEVIERVAQNHDRLPAVIFVTAFDCYAVKAFEARALDYILKPIDNARFHDAVQRVRDQLIPAEPEGHAPAPDTAVPMHGPDPARHDYIDRVAVRLHDRFVFVRMSDVDWIESAANYVQVHTRSREFLLRMTMCELEAKLDPRQFVRIHRSTIVNIDRVAELKPSLHGDFAVALLDGTALRMSRGYRERVFTR